MRNILMATLVLAPVLVHAQAPSPAQPGAQTPVLESRLVSPGAVNGAAAAKVGPPTSILLEPKLIKWTNVAIDRHASDDDALYQEHAVTVSMIVNEKGIPTDLKIVDSEDPRLNNGVLDAVAQYRFTPASLNSKATAVPLSLKVHVVPQAN